MTMRPGTMPDAGVDAAGAPPGSGLGAASGRAPGGARPPAVETGRAAVGRRGERIAARYLGDRGWRVLCPLYTSDAADDKAPVDRRVRARS